MGPRHLLTLFGRLVQLFDDRVGLELVFGEALEKRMFLKVGDHPQVKVVHVSDGVDQADALFQDVGVLGEKSLKLENCLRIFFV